MDLPRNIELPRLPRGPHDLPREKVEQSQRNRILFAVTEVMAEQGYAATSVSDIVANAGVSRSTFYQLFDDRLDCFLAANEVARDILMSAMSEQLRQIESDHKLTPEERVDALLAAYLEITSRYPAVARVFLVEVYAAGPRAVELRSKAFEEFVDLFLAARLPGGDGSNEVSDEERTITEVIVAAVSSLVTNAVGAGNADSLQELREPLMLAVARLNKSRD